MSRLTPAERAPARWPLPGACTWGDDPQGLWCELDLLGEVQRLRWIEPGEFWMGSPQDEQGRDEDEGPRHRVRLTSGLWLADSACTQALWQAVMGANPSHFKGDTRRPVEQVSWTDVQGFLQRLQGRLPPGVQAALPSEAEWEYACRAGTQTPFNLGEDIDPAQVNYDGNYPYRGGAKAEYRGQTVPVKTLPPNAWGLYEMHGNVWEWCADGPRQYTKQPQTDPVRARGGDRALRGGSWDIFGRLCRSALRLASEPGHADHGVGFRLALRSMVQPGQGTAAERP